MDYLKELTKRYPVLEQMREPIYEAYVLLKECYESFWWQEMGEALQTRSIL